MCYRAHFSILPPFRPPAGGILMHDRHSCRPSAILITVRSFPQSPAGAALLQGFVPPLTDRSDLLYHTGAKVWSFLIFLSQRQQPHCYSPLASQRTVPGPHSKSRVNRRIAPSSQAQGSLTSRQPVTVTAAATMTSPRKREPMSRLVTSIPATAAPQAIRN